MTPQLEKELALAGADGAAITAQLAADQTALLDKLYPAPTEREITDLYATLRSREQAWRNSALRERSRRYMRDVTPEKFKKNLQGDRRFYSRMTHNEIARVVGAQTMNAPKVIILPSGDTPKARDAAAKETRWSNQLLQAFERLSAKPIRRRVVDCQNEIGKAFYEVYLTGSYDDLETEPRIVADPSSGMEREETPTEVLKRTEGDLQSRRLPIGLRYVDGLSAFVEEGDEGVSRALIVEYKSRRTVFESMLKKGIDLSEMADPAPQAYGSPTDYPQTSGDRTIETIRYYDQRWMAYLVNGKLVGEIEEHGLPGVPVFPVWGMVTGSPNEDEQVEGICYGMESMELTVNDLLTLAVDVQYTYSRPKFVIETPIDKDIMRNAPGSPDAGKPAVVDLSQPGVVQLNPGQKLVNVLQGFQPYLQLPVIQTVMSLWQRSGLNPIAQGESPGASPAGYTVSTLTENATSVYEDCVRNEAQAWSRVVDFCRKMVRDTIKERVYLSAPVMDGTKAGSEWLGLAPDDVSETPAIVTIDPTSNANRMAKRQSLQEGNKQGFIPRRVVQLEGYGADDPSAWDDEIILDAGEQQLAQWSVQSAMEALQAFGQQAQAPPPGSGLVGPDGQPVSSADPRFAGAGTPAPPNPPSVGAEQAAASHGGVFGTKPGPAAFPSAAARAGQSSNGYIPANQKV